mgnify:CR=1 FL=1|tara:strand:+ start:1633 stop:2343 length:711 start_codon:yes stop_codon:yes gene_type:complete
MLSLDNLDERIFLQGSYKIIFVIFVFCIMLLIIITTGDWFKALLMLNISLHYRDFIKFFSDFNDEEIDLKIINNNKDNKDNKDISLSNNNNEITLSNVDNESFQINLNQKKKERMSVPANIGITKNFNDYIENLYGSLIDYNINYNDNLPGLSSVPTENIIIEKFYNDLYDLNENNDINKYNNSPNETLIDPFSKAIFSRDQKYFNRYLEPFAADDIKILSTTNLNNNTEWWDSVF